MNTETKVFDTFLDIDIYRYTARVTYILTVSKDDITIVSIEALNEEEEYVPLPYLGLVFNIIESEIKANEGTSTATPDWPDTLR